jgi:hypothetical protein
MNDLRVYLAFRVFMRLPDPLFRALLDPENVRVSRASKIRVSIPPYLNSSDDTLTIGTLPLGRRFTPGMQK